MSRFVDLRRTASESPAPRRCRASQTGPQSGPSRGSTATSRRVAVVTVPACHLASVHRHTSRADGPSLVTQAHGRGNCARAARRSGHCPQAASTRPHLAPMREFPSAASRRREPRPAVAAARTGPLPVSPSASNGHAPSVHGTADGRFPPASCRHREGCIAPACCRHCRRPARVSVRRAPAVDPCHARAVRS